MIHQKLPKKRIENTFITSAFLTSPSFSWNLAPNLYVKEITCSRPGNWEEWVMLWTTKENSPHYETILRCWKSLTVILRTLIHWCKMCCKTICPPGTIPKQLGLWSKRPQPTRWHRQQTLPKGHEFPRTVRSFQTPQQDYKALEQTVSPHQQNYSQNESCSAD